MICLFNSNIIYNYNENNKINNMKMILDNFIIMRILKEKVQVVKTNINFFNYVVFFVIILWIIVMINWIFVISLNKIK